MPRGRSAPAGGPPASRCPDRCYVVGSGNAFRKHGPRWHCGCGRLSCVSTAESSSTHRRDVADERLTGPSRTTAPDAERTAVGPPEPVHEGRTSGVPRHRTHGSDILPGRGRRKPLSGAARRCCTEPGLSAREGQMMRRLVQRTALSALAALAALTLASVPSLGVAAAEREPGTFTGRGFEACSAPSSETMDAWLASP